MSLCYFSIEKVGDPRQRGAGDSYATSSQSYQNVRCGAARVSWAGLSEAITRVASGSGLICRRRYVPRPRVQMVKVRTQTLHTANCNIPAIPLCLYLLCCVHGEQRVRDQSRFEQLLSEHSIRPLACLYVGSALVAGCVSTVHGIPAMGEYRVDEVLW